MLVSVLVCVRSSLQVYTEADKNELVSQAIAQAEEEAMIVQVCISISTYTCAAYVLDSSWAAALLLALFGGVCKVSYNCSSPTLRPCFFFLCCFTTVFLASWDLLWTTV